jgi:sterol 3beta-glucosyltransferase
MRIGLQAWGSEGDIQPFTALAAGLVKAGHSVTLVVTDNAGRDYGELARRFGYHLVPVPNPVIPHREEAERVWRQIIEIGNPIRQAEYVLRVGFDPAAEAMYRAARHLCSESDAVIGHFFVHPLRVAAAKAGVPMATVNIVHNCLPSAHVQPPGVPNLGRWFYPVGWRLARFMVNRIFLPRVNGLRAREGLTPDADVMTQTWAADRLNLLAVSPSICLPPPDWEPRHRVCGFLNPPAGLAADELPEGLEEFLAAGEPPVYFTFGSMMIDSPDFVREVADFWAEAARLAGCRAVLQLPYGEWHPRSSHRQVFCVRRSPYKEVFSRCALVVHHGGAGTTQSALLTGRPSIVVAHVSDQEFWGSELERLGVAGRTLKRRRLTAATLAAGIRQGLAAPEMGRRAREIGTQMKAEDGVTTAVGLIERHLLG